MQIFKISTNHITWNTFYQLINFTINDFSKCYNIMCMLFIVFKVITCMICEKFGVSKNSVRIGHRVKTVIIVKYNYNLK